MILDEFLIDWFLIGAVSETNFLIFREKIDSEKRKREYFSKRSEVKMWIDKIG